MSATSDVARMLTLVPWLLQRPGASLTELSETFGVPVKRIEQDLDHLDFCGLPGLGGGDLFEVTIVADRVVLRLADELKRPMRPTATEALRLVLSVDAVAEVLGDELPALRSAVEKVRTALGVPEGAADVLEPAGPATVAAARHAIAAGWRVRLAYQGRNDTVPQDREVDPWALHVTDGIWYLQGHDHGVGDRRTFRLDRIADLIVLDEPVTVPRPDDLPPPRYVPDPEDQPIELEVTPRGRWLLDAIDVEEIEETDDGGARLRFHTDAPGWVTRLVLMAGGDAVVRSPASVRDAAADLARSALRRYPDTTS